MSDEGRPVLAGLVALAGVGLVVGLLVSGAVLAATQVLGLGDDSSTAGEATTRQSMYLPTPESTAGASEPLVTLAPDPEQTATAGLTSDVTPSQVESAAPAISLSVSTTEASPGETITLSGVYPGGEGATLVVERLTSGQWGSFVDVSTTVSNETFSTGIRTSVHGVSTFRVRDAASGLTSNEVTFTIR